MSPTAAGRTAERLPQLVATDLDGTFLDESGTVSELNAAAVAAAQDAGIVVVFATGRPVRWLDVIADLPGAHPVVIASNGAALYDLGAGRVLDRICVEAERALTAVDRIRADVDEVSFAFESGTRFGYEPTYTPWADDDGSDPAIFSGPIEQIAAEEDFVKILVQSRALDSDALLDRVRASVGDLLTATHSVTRAYGLVELSAPGVHKGAMLQRLCTRLEIEAADVAAFGDMPNDLGMLQWAGHPYVVANAHPALQDQGFGLTSSNDDSGVGRVLADWAASASRSAASQAARR